MSLFPPVPPGIVITPFSEFIPAGYARAVDEHGNDIEVDAYAGLPTVRIATEEEVLQRRKDRKKRRHAGQCTDATGRLVPWWEEWERGEHERTTSVCGSLCFADRVYQASDDFRVGRTWPQIALGVRSIWDHFRIYTGLLSSMPVYRKPRAKERGLDHPDIGYANDGSDDEGDHDMPRARHTVTVQDTLEQIAQPGKQLEPDHFDESSAQKQLLCAFTDDIEKGTKIFLGAYMRHSDLIWSEPNLFIAPTVLHFFLRFMLRSSLFHDSPSHTDDLIRAIAIAETAVKELPLTAQIGRVLPGKFDLACREHWGKSIPLDEVFSGAADVHPDVSLTPSTSESAFQTWASWTDVSVPSLCDILGPTTFPTEYAPCIAEHSTRRIRAVIPLLHQEHEHGVAELGPEGVEAVLEKRFARVILDPWIHGEDEATEEIQAPVVMPLPSTRALVPGHDPYRDAVALLVEPSHALFLTVGMGLCGTWVGLGRTEEQAQEPDRRDYWYIEDLMTVLPSFYVESDGVLGTRVVEDAEDDVD